MSRKNTGLKLTHGVYSVVERKPAPDFWLRIGDMYTHADGKGYSIVLAAYPLDHELTCRELIGEDAAEKSVFGRSALKLG